MMMKDNVKLKLIKSYNRSVLIDQLIILMVMCIVFLVIFLISSTALYKNKLFMSTQFIVILCFHLFSDILFGGRSLGKRLCRITIISDNHKSPNKKLSLKMCSYRRLLEILYNPYYYRDHEDAFDKIEKKTGTFIINYIRK